MATLKNLVVKDENDNELTLWVNNHNEIFMQVSDVDGEYLAKYICLCKEDAIELYNELGNLIKQI
jgi:hypothetical protein